MQGRRFHRFKGGYPRDPREVIHVLRGKSSRSCKGGDPGDSREVIHTKQETIHDTFRF